VFSFWEGFGFTDSTGTKADDTKLRQRWLLYFMSVSVLGIAAEPGLLLL